MRVMHGFSASDCFSPIMKTHALSVNPLPPSQFQPRLIKKLRLHIIYIDKQSHCKWIQTFFFMRAFLGRGWMITFSLVPRPFADKRCICTICVLDYFESKNIDYWISELYIYIYFSLNIMWSNFNQVQDYKLQNSWIKLFSLKIDVAGHWTGCSAID